MVNNDCWVFYTSKDIINIILESNIHILLINAHIKELMMVFRFIFRCNSMG